LRIKIKAQTELPSFFPFNYQQVLQAVLYDFIRKSSSEYASFLHEKGYVKDGINKFFKFFTFSKLIFTPNIIEKKGFSKVRMIEFIFSTTLEKNFKHIILGIFSNHKIRLFLSGKNIVLNIVSVDVLEDPMFTDKEKFICISPIAVSTMKENEKGRRVPHYLDYMNPCERDHFIENVKKNLVNKYETLQNGAYKGEHRPFKFDFDLNYITRKNGRISKLIEFKNGIKIKAMEAPFTVEADPKLIKIGYECGWGEKNSAGFGCVNLLKA